MELRLRAGEASALARRLVEQRRLLCAASENAAAESELLPGLSQQQLRERVRAYTRALRDSGEPPERALVLVKGAVASAFVRRVEVWNGREWLDRIVGWCIEEYYAA